MAIGLGLDTGGTYTDGVIFDFNSRRILQTAKSVTIKENLTIGINQVLDQFSEDMLAKTELVSLSTTLATNACVEGKGCRARLILIGCDRRVIERYGADIGLPAAAEIIFLDGGHNQAGQIASQPDWKELADQVSQCVAVTDAFAVVELWGVRNASFEEKAREIIAGICRKPIVCGHEITGELNSLKRATSALLNARLLPLISDFLDAIKSSLTRRNIKAPLVIVRGDGSLMAEDFARARPVETLLCGPAASVAGGLALTSEKNCLIIDMGGTTSDLAMVRDGQPDLAVAGARIGSWQTGIHSILIHTVGLGGDSLIRHNRENKLDIGPRRAAPLSWAASRWPQILQLLRQIRSEERRHTQPLSEFFYRIVDEPDCAFYDAEEQAVLKALADGPLSISQLAEQAGSSIYSLKVERLEQQGQIMRCGLTPTDIMHLTGEFTAWNLEAAECAVDIAAFQLAIDRSTLVSQVRNQVKEALFVTLVQMLLEHEYKHVTGKTGPKKQLTDMARDHFQRSQAGQKRRGFLDLNFNVDVPLVGIGAPTHLYLPDVAKALQTTCMIPEHAAVANAVGAITGHVVAVESVLIKPLYTPAGINGYYGYAATENRFFKTHDLAITWAREKAADMARLTAIARGAGEPEVSITVDRHEAPYASMFLPDEEAGPETGAETRLHQPQDADSSGPAHEAAGTDPLWADENETPPNMLFLETKVEARATGRIGAIKSV